MLGEYDEQDVLLVLAPTSEAMLFSVQANMSKPPELEVLIAIFRS